ncbi:hypothetical protein SLEP1_g25986 [Rubroshorea leprosula]|uniref:Transposase n=1 Tax=Rubroshorea leprosula TaxID=152421 RepID=A0AAV5JKU5_9ROSI|nr:hypothetical protein SLEP1_g25986 [Rubroshorea leprosula]
MARKKQLKTESEEQEISCGVRASWTLEKFNLFVDICVQGAYLGKKVGNHWGEAGWQWVLNEMEAKGAHFRKAQLKNKWDWMREQWKLWKDLIGNNRTGLGWNPKTGTVDAPSEFWEERIKENPEYEKLREKGIGKELFDKYELLFDNVARGDHAYSPSIGQLPREIDAIEVDKVVDEDTTICLEEDFEQNLEKLIGNGTTFTPTQFSLGVSENENLDEQSKSIGKKHKKIDGMTSSQPKQIKNANKGKKPQTGAMLITNQMKELQETIANRTSTMGAIFGDKPGCTIEEILNDLLTLPDMDPNYMDMEVNVDMNDVERALIDEDEEECQMIVSMVGSINWYYLNYVNKEPCMNSLQTGYIWLLEIIRENDTRCINMFRMDKNTLISLCNDLQSNYGLEASRRISVIEKVCMFLYTLALGASNRQVQERFQHSGETVSRSFHEVLKAMLYLSIDLIKPQDPTFSTIPLEILDDKRYMPHFKDCIGAIDGTHILACVKKEDQIRFINGRKGIPTQNVMAACSFDLQFTFVLAGWEGTAHDARIFQYAIRKKELNFPKPPPGKYYLVDARYPQIQGYLGPYKGTRYHLSDFERGGEPRGYKEIFNRWHSSLRERYRDHINGHT